MSGPSFSARCDGAGRRRGHTLWEVLLALALLASVGALVAPSLARSGGESPDDVDRLARGVTTLLAGARSTALERGITIELIIDARTARAWTIGHAGGDAQLVATSTLEYPRGATLAADGPRARFVFRPSGAASGDRLVVRSAGASRFIAIDRWTGAAHVATR